MPVQVSGNQLIEKTQSITVGSKLLVVGFITSHKTSKWFNTVSVACRANRIYRLGDSQMARYFRRRKSSAVSQRKMLLKSITKISLH